METLALHLVASQVRAARAGDVEAAHWLITYATEVLQMGLDHPFNVNHDENEPLCLIPQDIAEYLHGALRDVATGKPADVSFGLRRRKGHGVDEHIYRERDTSIWSVMRKKVKAGETLDEAAFEVSSWLWDKVKYKLSDSQVRKIYLREKKHMKEVHQIE